MEGKKKNSNSKLFWSIFFAVVTVSLLYLFTVVYFFFISPYNISLKIGFWPFLSNQTIGELYLDATVEINFKVVDNISYEEEQKSVVGVNVKKDGFIIAPFAEFRDCTKDTEITISANSGALYKGVLLYGDMNFNLAVLKCENMSGSEQIKIPFVSIANLSNGLYADTEVLAIASPLQDKTVWEGEMVIDSMINVYATTEIEGYNAVDFVIENCYEMAFDVEESSFTGGVIYNTSGSVLGLSYDKTLEDGNYVVIPVDYAKLFLDDVVRAYKNDKEYRNDLVYKLIGFDNTELQCHMNVSNASSGRTEGFYFYNSWQVYTSQIVEFSNDEDDGFYVFRDFVINDNVTLSANSVISSLSVNSTAFEATKVDIMNGVYKMKTGDTVVISYYDFADGSAQSVQFTV